MKNLALAIVALFAVAVFAGDGQSCVFGKRLRQSSTCTSKSTTTTTTTTQSVKQSSSTWASGRVKFLLPGTCSGGSCR